MSNGGRVLILEDEPIIGFALEDMLIEIGCAAVLLTTRIDEAMQIIREERVDAAILDVNIHGERSYPVADALKLKQVPYIFASGYGDTEHPPEHRLTPTLVKPYNVDDIRAALHGAFKASQA
jgi:DNA-binding response OmpR family regulator